jgi:hypothetical protein
MAEATTYNDAARLAAYDFDYRRLKEVLSRPKNPNSLSPYVTAIVRRYGDRVLAGNPLIMNANALEGEEAREVLIRSIIQEYGAGRILRAVKHDKGAILLPTNPSNPPTKLGAGYWVWHDIPRPQDPDDPRKRDLIIVPIGKRGPITVPLSGSWHRHRSGKDAVRCYRKPGSKKSPNLCHDTVEYWLVKDLETYKSWKRVHTAEKLLALSAPFDEGLSKKRRHKDVVVASLQKFGYPRVERPGKDGKKRLMLAITKAAARKFYTRADFRFETTWAEPPAPLPVIVEAFKADLHEWVEEEIEKLYELPPGLKAVSEIAWQTNRERGEVAGIFYPMRMYRVHAMKRRPLAKFEFNRMEPKAAALYAKRIGLYHHLEEAHTYLDGLFKAEKADEAAAPSPSRIYLTQDFPRKMAERIIKENKAVEKRYMLDNLDSVVRQAEILERKKSRQDAYYRNIAELWYLANGESWPEDPPERDPDAKPPKRAKSRHPKVWKRDGRTVYALPKGVKAPWDIDGRVTRFRQKWAGVVKPKPVFQPADDGAEEDFESTTETEQGEHEANFEALMSETGEATYTVRFEYGRPPQVVDGEVIPRPQKITGEIPLSAKIKGTRIFMAERQPEIYANLVSLPVGATVIPAYKEPGVYEAPTIRDLCEALSAKEYEAFEWAYLHRLTTAEIATRMGVGPETVKEWLKRGADKIEERTGMRPKRRPGGAAGASVKKAATKKAA